MDGMTNDTTPTVKGMGAEVNGLVNIYGTDEDGNTIYLGQAQAGENGEWSFTVPEGKLVDGKWTFTAKNVDAAGNEGEVSDGWTIVLDTEAPSELPSITEVSDDVDLGTGRIEEGEQTNDPTPTVKGNGAGTHGTVNVYATKDGVTVLLGTATADENGDWVLDGSAVTALTEDGSWTITARNVDAAGNEGEASDGWTIVLDTEAPSELPSITEVSDDVDLGTGRIEEGEQTNDPTPTVKGAGAGTHGTVNIYATKDGVTVLLGTATADENGNWVLDGSAVTALTSDGSWTITARNVDAAGNEGEASDGWTIVLDREAPSELPSITEVSDDVDLGTGRIEEGEQTNDTTPTVKGDGAGANGKVNVYATKDGVTVLLGTAIADGDGDWVLDGSNVTALTEDGSWTITARNVDEAGNEGEASDGWTIVLDTEAPTEKPEIKEVIDDVDQGTGDIGEGGLTNDPTLTGEGAGVNGKVNIYATKGDQTILLGTVTADENGHWELNGEDAAALTEDGSWTITARNVDESGNESEPSEGRTIILDTETPSGTAEIDNYTDDRNPETGDWDSNSWTNDDAPLLNGRIVGTFNEGDVVAVYRNGVRIGVASVTGTEWHFEDSELKDGSYTYEVAIESASGVTGEKSEGFIINVDITDPTAKPIIEHYWDDVGVDRGPFESGTTTDDRNPVLHGTIEGDLAEGETVQIYEGNKLIGTATMTDAENWTFELPSLEDGSTHTYTARVVDQAGNFSDGSTSDPFVISVDLTVVVNKQNTTDTTPVITGSTGFDIQEGEYMEVIIHGRTYSSKDGSVEIDFANNTWALQIPADGALAYDTYNVFARLLDADGKVITSDDSAAELLIEELKVTIDVPGSADSKNKATALTIGEDGQWRIFSNMNILDANGTDITSIGSFKHNTLTGNQGTLGSVTFIDFDRDGYMDLFGQDSEYPDGSQSFKYTPGFIQESIPGAPSDKSNIDYYAFQLGNAEDSSSSRRERVDFSGGGTNSANIWSWFGGTAGYDKDGDGYVDIVFGDDTPNDEDGGKGFNSSVVINDKGIFRKDPSLVWDAPSNLEEYVDEEGQATPEKLLSSVDLNNDGAVDYVFHGDAGSNFISGNPNSGDFRSSNAYRLVVVNSEGNGKVGVTQIINEVFDNNNDDIYNGQSMTWSDFDGDGYMDLFLSTTRAGNNSQIFFNDGAGHLSGTGELGKVQTKPGHTYNMSDNMKGGGSVAVDWNADGRMDIIEIPFFYGADPSGTQNVLLFTNDTFGGTAAFTQSILTTVADEGTGSAITGLVTLDIDWNGAKDLILFTGNKGATTVINEEVIGFGTSLHLKILDQNGINSLYGNTVKLYDSKGNLVATQILNPQSGNQTSDSTALVDFYGLDPDETYTAVMLRIVNGVEQHVGGLDDIGGYSITNVNGAWAGLRATEGYSSHVLTAEAGDAVNDADITNGIVGTGYNDTFYATQGNDTYSGGGGTVIVSGERVWSNTGGIDIVDYKNATQAITVDMSLTAAQNTGFGEHIFRDIEGISGTQYDDTISDDAGDNVFNGRAGSDTFNLTKGGRDTLVYEVIDDTDATGGNGNDQVNRFMVGNYLGTPDADRIDLSKLLIGYEADANGPAHWINGVATIDEGDKIGEYLSVVNENGNSILYIDRDGAGSAYQMTALLTLNNEMVDLATLLANHQIVVGYSNTFYSTFSDERFKGVGRQWTQEDSVDTVDYSDSTKAVVANLTTGTAAGDGIDTLVGIDGLIGSVFGDTFTGKSGADNIFDGRGGDDTYNLVAGGHDTLLFKLLDEAAPTGGNGSDTANGFHIGNIETDGDADIIDLSKLFSKTSGIPELSGCTDADGVFKLDAKSEGIHDYLKVTSDGINTTISVDVDGGGDSFAMLLTLNNVDTTLEELVRNSQIMV